MYRTYNVSVIYYILKVFFSCVVWNGTKEISPNHTHSFLRSLEFTGYRRRWLLSVGAYSFCQQENESLTVNMCLTANMRLTVNMRLIGIPLITMGGVIIINASGVQYFGILRVKRLTNIL